jgi:hypothetical protein
MEAAQSPLLVNSQVNPELGLKTRRGVAGSTICAKPRALAACKLWNAQHVKSHEEDSRLRMAAPVGRSGSRSCNNTALCQHPWRTVNSKRTQTRPALVIAHSHPQCHTIDCRQSQNCKPAYVTRQTLQVLLDTAGMHNTMSGVPRHPAPTYTPCGSHRQKKHQSRAQSKRCTPTYPAMLSVGMHQ